jgi:multicomponent K+:H+ antiporter subunit G
MNPVMEVLISALLLTGGFLALVGTIGLAKLSDLYRRIHGPTKTTTLGVGGTLLASALWFSATRPGISLHEVLVTVFLFLTAPVSAHLLLRAARHRKLQALPPGRKAAGRD